MRVPHCPAKEGAAGTRFPRNVENAAIKPESGDELMTPNPREVSRKLLTRGEHVIQARVPLTEERSAPVRIRME